MALPPGFNAFLIVIAIVVGVLAAGAALYTVLAYAHPDDSEGGGWAGAWVGRGVAALAFAQAGWTVLLFPLDVANAKACSPGLAAAYCTFAIPSRQLW
jgi:LMBR1 domain-containing protein 1